MPERMAEYIRHVKKLHVLPGRIFGIRNKVASATFDKNHPQTDVAFVGTPGLFTKVELHQ